MSRKTSETLRLPSRQAMGHPIFISVLNKTFRSCRWWANCHHQNVRVINLHRPHFSRGVPAKTAPLPLFRRSHQSPRHGIAMNVAQLFDSLLLGPDIEVIKACLPEAVRLFGATNTEGAPGLAGFARPGNGAAL